MGALFYLGVKFLAYSGWLYYGLRSRGKSSWGRAVAFGLVRLLMGFFFGVLIYLASSWVVVHLSSNFGLGVLRDVLAYLSVYVPVRWVEWSIMAALIAPQSFSLAQLAFGAGGADRRWRAGGILLSCLADIPLIVSLGGVIPTGRFLC
jgi:hypothetical protein